MVQLIGIAKAITSLNEIDRTFHLTRSNDATFFTEWFETLPALTESDTEKLDFLKKRYVYYAADNSISEGTLNFIIVAPLLEMVHLCDPPFKIKAEQAVKIELEDKEMILQGFIDALVVQNQFWVVVIEAKRYGFNASLAIPQTLAYMMANPQRQKPVFGMVTNGEDYIFVKLNQEAKSYDFSDKLTLSKRTNEDFYRVLQVMKQIKEYLLQ